MKRAVEYVSVDPGPSGKRREIYLKMDETGDAITFEAVPQSDVRNTTTITQIGEELALNATAADESWVDDSDGSFPEIWTRDNWMERRSRHLWLSCRNGMLGCRYCIRAQFTGLPEAEQIRVSPEWTNYTVTFNGTTREQQLKSLRNKISRHEVSEAHQRAERLFGETPDAPPELRLSQAVKQLGKNAELTAKVFYTAYSMALGHFPIKSFRHMIDLQCKNGVSLQPALHPCFEPALIVIHIASEFRRRFIQNLVDNAHPLSIVVDELAVATNRVILVLYLRAVFDGEVQNLYMDLIELIEDQTPNTVVNLILSTLDSFGFTDEYLSERLVSIAYDGISPIIGRTSGVERVLRERFPRIVLWPCLSHRLETIVNDTLNQINMPNYFHDFIDTVYVISRQCPRNLQELEINVPELAAELAKVGYVVDTKQVASTFATARAVWTTYHILAEYFLTVSTDITRSPVERAKYLELRATLESIEFIRQFGLLYDVLEELHNLKVLLSESSLSIHKAHNVLKRSVSVLTSLKDKVGANEKYCETAINECNFKTVPIGLNEKIQPLDRVVFLQGVIDSLTLRINDSVGSLFEDLEVLNSATWPREIGPNFGIERVNRIVDLLKMDEIQDKVEEGFRETIAAQGEPASPEVELLRQMAVVIPRGTAVCEKIQNELNAIGPNDYNDTMYLGSALFCKLHGPSLGGFEALPYVRTWLIKNSVPTDVRLFKKNICPVPEEKAPKKPWSLL